MDSRDFKRFCKKNILPILSATGGVVGALTASKYAPPGNSKFKLIVGGAALGSTLGYYYLTDAFSRNVLNFGVGWIAADHASAMAEDTPVVRDSLFFGPFMVWFSSLALVSGSLDKLGDNVADSVRTIEHSAERPRP